jgi:hypothetical protein
MNKLIQKFSTFIIRFNERIAESNEEHYQQTKKIALEEHIKYRKVIKENFWGKYEELHERSEAEKEEVRLKLTGCRTIL